MKGAPLVRRASIALILGLLAATAVAETSPPPYFPGSHKKFSGTLHGLAVRLFGGMLIRDNRIEELVRYLESLPGDLKAAKLELRGEPRAKPHEVHDFYLGWAAENGYRLVCEIRTPLEEEEGRSEYGEEETGFTDAFHKPGADGGVLLVQARDTGMIWMWQDGHVPVGPAAAIWLGLPRGKPDLTPPEGEQPWTQPGGLPALDIPRLELRIELDRWELDTVTDHLARGAAEQARARKSTNPPFAALLETGPTLTRTVRHAWYLSFRATEAEREAVLAPWIGWADAHRLPLIAEGETPAGWFTLRLRGGEEGGLLLTLVAPELCHVTVFDGGPDLASVGRALASTQEEETP